MLIGAHDHELTAPPGLWDSILNGGPLFILLNFLFAVSVIVALVVSARRAVLPWMLLAACGPFIFASAAAHVGYWVGLVCMCGDFHPPKDVSQFVYPTRLFNWGCIVSLTLVVVSLARWRNARISAEGDV